MRELLEILSGIEPEVDFESAYGIISNHLIDEDDIPSMIADINDTFGIDLDESDVTPAAFDTVESIWALIQEMQD